MNVNSIVVVASAVWLLVAFWNRNAIPRSVDYRGELATDPAQARTRKAPFDARYNGVDYRIEPQYEYELYGMIVSYRHHDGNSRMHRRAGDHLNMLDVCVIWGDNTRHPDLNALDFWNGIFTCNVQTRDREAWEAFNMNQLSNNHLISDRDWLRERVEGVRIGDQIRVKGWLASYTGPAGTRGTSTTRTDTGDGACETVYVDEFDVVQPVKSGWRRSMYGALLVLVASLWVHFRRPYRPHPRRGGNST